MRSFALMPIGNIGEVLEKVKSLGMKCGLTVKPKTDVAELYVVNENLANFTASRI
jgi:pentose-5-phosphate-3-epimerase